MPFAHENGHVAVLDARRFVLGFPPPLRQLRPRWLRVCSPGLHFGHEPGATADGWPGPHVAPVGGAFSVMCRSAGIPHERRYLTTVDSAASSFDFDGSLLAPARAPRPPSWIRSLTTCSPVVATDDGLDQAVERVVYGRVAAWPVRSPVGGLVGHPPAARECRPVRRPSPASGERAR